ncbi:hypothetical protein [Burkholderia sp. A1]|uniref:hypothetical protein n=1 Tax=Burkholderia sp. A1 TaxID=148446 RepID=UPI00190F9782|nr:hypothetical protein [Burkholderia sp. A1]
MTIGAKDGSARQGWVCEQDHPLVRMCRPWDWPGFELIDNSNIMPVDNDSIQVIFFEGLAWPC